MRFHFLYNLMHPFTSINSPIRTSKARKCIFRCTVFPKPIIAVFWAFTRSNPRLMWFFSFFVVESTKQASRQESGLERNEKNEGKPKTDPFSAHTVLVHASLPRPLDHGFACYILHLSLAHPISHHSESPKMRF